MFCNCWIFRKFCNLGIFIFYIYIIYTRTMTLPRADAMFKECEHVSPMRTCFALPACFGSVGAHIAISRGCLHSRCSHSRCSYSGNIRPKVFPPKLELVRLCGPQQYIQNSLTSLELELRPIYC